MMQTVNCWERSLNNPDNYLNDDYDIEDDDGYLDAMDAEVEDRYCERRLRELGRV